MDKVRKFIIRFQHNLKGVVAVEFALMLPLLVTILGATVELSNMIMVSKRVMNVAQTTSDLIAQETDITTAGMTEIFTSAVMIVYPYNPVPITIGVSSVRFDSSGAAYEDWEASYNGGGVLLPETLAAPFSEPDESIIIVNTTYTYTPILSFIIPDTRTFNESFFVRPRKVAYINYN